MVTTKVEEFNNNEYLSAKEILKSNKNNELYIDQNNIVYRHCFYDFDTPMLIPISNILHNLAVVSSCTHKKFKKFYGEVFLMNQPTI